MTTPKKKQALNQWMDSSLFVIKEDKFFIRKTRKRLEYVKADGQYPRMKAAASRQTTAG